MDGKPLPFAVGGVPILGTPFELLAEVPLELIVCRCGAKHPLLLVGVGAKAMCPGCRHVYRISKTNGVEIQQLVPVVDSGDGEAS